MPLTCRQELACVVIDDQYSLQIKYIICVLFLGLVFLFMVCDNHDFSLTEALFHLSTPRTPRSGPHPYFLQPKFSLFLCFPSHIVACEIHSTPGLKYYTVEMPIPGVMQLLGHTEMPHTGTQDFSTGKQTSSVF